jgi:hypothetical protein
MKKLFSDFWVTLMNDEVAVRRWGRSALMGIAGGGIAFGDQLAALVNSPGMVTKIKVASVVAGFLSLLINLGEKNAPAAAPLPNDTTPAVK